MLGKPEGRPRKLSGATPSLHLPHASINTVELYMLFVLLRCEIHGNSRHAAHKRLVATLAFVLLGDFTAPSVMTVGSEAGRYVTWACEGGRAW